MNHPGTESAATSSAITIVVSVDADEILGGGEWSPVLRLYLEANGSAQLITTSRHTSENAVPMDVWHQRTLRWQTTISQGSLVLPDPVAIADLAERVRPLLERVHAGHTVDWDGSNHVGALDDDATEAFDEIARLLDEADWTSETAVWDAAEWLAESWSDVAVTADSTDEELTKIASDLEGDAQGAPAVLINTVDALKARRDELRAERDEAG